MNVGLIDVDGHHWPSLPLMKLSAWHKEQGDMVEWWEYDKMYDRIYMSKVFDDTYTPDMPIPPNATEVIQGGTGYGLHNVLPSEIEHIYPDYDIYPDYTTDTAYGFLSRGCPRGCGFCIVGDKEGRKSRKVANLSEFWRDQREIKLLDPNLLACPDHIDLLSQLVDSRAWVDYTQGLDIRLVNSSNIDLINRIKTKRIHFAWDNPRDNLAPIFREVGQALRIQDRRRRLVYVLTNYNSTHEEDLYRIYTLIDLRYDPYVMVYNRPTAPRITRQLQRWCNSFRIRAVVPIFEDYYKEES